MKFYSIFSMGTACLLSLAAAQEVVKSGEEKAGSKGYDFLELKVGEDLVLKNCKVTRQEADALIVSHQGGIARVSLFDLIPDLQERFNFDPVVALEKYRKDQEVLQAQRKMRFLEAEKFKALEAAREADEEKYAQAKKLWIPATGTVLKRNRHGTFVRAYEIKMVPTKTKSTLGFTVDGPDKKVMEPFANGVLCLTNITGEIGTKWKGYVSPVCVKQVPRNPGDPPKIPVHEALDLKD